MRTNGPSIHHAQRAGVWLVFFFFFPPLSLFLYCLVIECTCYSFLENEREREKKKVAVIYKTARLGRRSAYKHRDIPPIPSYIRFVFFSPVFILFEIASLSLI